MIITNEAKEALKEILKEYGKTGIRFSAADNTPVALSLDAPEATDRVEIINGIQVAMDEQALVLLEQVTLDVEETEEGLQLVLVGG
ncbi:hypothetical protein [Anoxybacteroides amylolyticum]|uniref:Iron-sulfur cluster biosynthesis family protein n=1 Tax=Anoxybacteroides amylolyticum TaxID=294699 RepID=A0A160F3N1_9BACL|nr:hypothetical protein [Anoxybacillus amylolyticus]ANB60957.1 iron-sulfur cluster biosynthesis family protein [Anoxybacillus amylolyticus]